MSGKLKTFYILHFTFFNRAVLCLLFCALYSVSLNAQSLAAYTDYRGHFQVFDNGIFHDLEYLPVKSFTVGGTTIGYVDNTGEFQIFYNGQKFHQTYAADTMFTYYNTDYLLAYKVGAVLSVFERGRSKKLSYFTTQVFAADSLIGWFDDSNYNLGVYYNGEITPLESSLLEPPRSIKTGSNILAYVNQSNFFKIFYHGQLLEIDNTAPDVFDVGRDIVAFIDGYNHYFHLFYKGDTAQVDLNGPVTFRLGFGIMAYVDYNNSFRVFANGATRRLLSSPPDFFAVRGNIILYAFNGEFRAFYDGESKLIDDFVPTDYKLTNDGVAYIDAGSRLKFFQRGKTYEVSSEPVAKYYVNNDVVWYMVGVNTWKVFYRGQNY